MTRSPHYFRWLRQLYVYNYITQWAKLWKNIAIDNMCSSACTIEKFFLIWISRSFKKGASDNTIISREGTDNKEINFQQWKAKITVFRNVSSLHAPSIATPFNKIPKNVDLPPSHYYLASLNWFFFFRFKAHCGIAFELLLCFFSRMQE